MGISGMVHIEESGLDLTRVVELYGDCIVNYCFGLLLNREDAQDAAQEVFLKASVKLVDFSNTAGVAAWLYRVAYTICIDVLRRRKLNRLFMLREQSKCQAEDSEDTYDFGLSPALQAALSALNPKDRALVYSRAVEEMEYGQLEAIYGAKSAALRKRYERAIHKLATLLGETEGERNG